VYLDQNLSAILYRFFDVFRHPDPPLSQAARLEKPRLPPIPTNTRDFTVEILVELRKTPTPPPVGTDLRACPPAVV